MLCWRHDNGTAVDAGIGGIWIFRVGIWLILPAELGEGFIHVTHFFRCLAAATDADCDAGSAAPAIADLEPRQPPALRQR